jgi:hypothetical protein
MFVEEESIEKEQFQLYGEDLRCLDSGKPMMSVFHYKAPIDYTIEFARRNVLESLLCSSHPLLRSFTIRRIGDNLFKYDKHMTLDDVFETTDETDVHKIFNLFDRKKDMYRVYASTRRKIVCVVWSHSIFDGVSVLHGCYIIAGIKLSDITPIQKPNLLLRSLYTLETIIRLPFFALDSQLTRDLQTPRFHTMRLKILDIKNIKNECSVSFPSVACSMYLSRLFKSLPLCVTYLKVFVSVYMKNEDSFNNYSVIPIVVYRHECGPKDIHNLLDSNKRMLFGFYELFRTNALTKIKSGIDALKPDVIFASMKTNDDIGASQMKQSLVYNYSSSAILYGCGIQAGPKYFHINTSIQSGMCKLG